MTDEIKFLFDKLKSYLETVEVKEPKNGKFFYDDTLAVKFKWTNICSYLQLFAALIIIQD